MQTLPKSVQLLHRPHLITPDGAAHWMRRIHGLDDRFHERREGSLGFLQRLAALASRRPRAMEDDDVMGEPIVEPTRPAAYAPRWLGQPDAELDCGLTLKDGVALISIDTPLVEEGFGFCGTWFHGYDSIQAALEEADADARVKGVFAHWKTPGGVVAPGIYELTAFMQGRSRAAKEGAKPVWSFCDLSASAGYWLTAQTDNVIAPGVGVVGSIGAVWAHVSAAGAYDKHGYKVQPVTFGKFKTAGADFRDLSEEELAHMQAIIDDLGEDFLAAVEAGRGAKLTVEMARETEARIFHAQHRDPEHSGLARGFVDSISPQREAFAAFVAELAKSTPIPAKPAGNPAARAAHSTMETEMKRAAKLAAIADIRAGKTEAKTAEEQLDAIKKILNEQDEEDGDGGGEEDPPVEDEEAAAKKKAEEEEKDKEAKARAARPAAASNLIDPKVAQAILALPEAKGREALAQRLAFKPGMTIDEAKADLAAAPKASTLVGTVHDPKLTADGGKVLSQEEQDIEAGAALARPKAAAALPF